MTILPKDSNSSRRHNGENVNPSINTAGVFEIKSFGKKYIYAVLIIISVICASVFVGYRAEKYPPPNIIAQLENIAASGDDVAELKLAEIYHQGWGVANDFPRAAQLYQQAANQGNSVAQFMLGCMYAKGEGVDKDFMTSYKWLALAEKNGTSGHMGALDAVKSHLTQKEIEDSDKWVADWSGLQKHQ